MYIHVAGFRQCDQAFKKKQKKTDDKRHRVAKLRIIPEDTKLWVTSWPVYRTEQRAGTIIIIHLGLHKIYTCLLHTPNIIRGCAEHITG